MDPFRVWVDVKMCADDGGEHLWREVRSADGSRTKVSSHPKLYFSDLWGRDANDGGVKLG